MEEDEVRDDELCDLHERVALSDGGWHADLHRGERVVTVHDRVHGEVQPNDPGVVGGVLGVREKAIVQRCDMVVLKLCGSKQCVLSACWLTQWRNISGRFRATMKRVSPSSASFDMQNQKDQSPLTPWKNAPACVYEAKIRCIKCGFCHYALTDKPLGGNFIVERLRRDQRAANAEQRKPEVPQLQG